MEYCLTQSDEIKAVTTKAVSETKNDLIEQKINSIEYLTKISITIRLINIISCVILVMNLRNIQDLEFFVHFF